MLGRVARPGPRGTSARPAMMDRCPAGAWFGHFTILGDGRAILLGEQITPSGDRMDILRFSNSARVSVPRFHQSLNSTGSSTIAPSPPQGQLSRLAHPCGVAASDPGDSSLRPCGSASPTVMRPPRRTSIQSVPLRSTAPTGQTLQKPARNCSTAQEVG
jgi:hypothetical protein